MTEKRFQYNVNKNCIEYDGKFVAYLNSVDGCRIANLWNGLYKENEQLKKDVARYRGNFREMEDVKCELAEENEQLRHDATILIQSNQDYRRENEELKQEAEEYNEDAMSYQTLYAQQLEKNEQLKRRNKKLEKHLRKFYCDEEWKLRELLGDFE